MTKNRCIELLKKMKHMFTETCAKIDENTALDMAVKAIEEIQQYRAIGTVEQLRTMFDGYWKLKDLCEEYEKYGLPSDYWKLNEMCREYSAIGTIEELKALKETDEDLRLKYCYEDLSEADNLGYMRGYNKAIDEFAKSLKTDYVNFDLYYILQNNNVEFENASLKSYRDMIDELAEQLKEGAE